MPAGKRWCLGCWISRSGQGGEDALAANLRTNIRNGALDFQKPVYGCYSIWKNPIQTNAAYFYDYERCFTLDDTVQGYDYSTGTKQTYDIYFQQKVYAQTNTIQSEGLNITETIRYRWCKYVDQLSLRATFFRMKNSRAFLGQMLDNKIYATEADIPPETSFTPDKAPQVFKCIDIYRNKMQTQVAAFMATAKDESSTSDVKINNKVEMPFGMKPEDGYIPEIIEITYAMQSP